MTIASRYCRLICWPACSILASLASAAEPAVKFSSTGNAETAVFHRHQLGVGFLSIHATHHGEDPEITLPGAILPSLQNFHAKGVTLGLDDLTVPVIQYSYWLNSNWSLDTFATIPPIVNVSGGGKLSAPINVVAGVGVGLDLLDFDKDKVNPAASARAWTPGFMATYHLGSPQSLIRPFIGVGPLYGFFTEVELNPAVLQTLNKNGLLIATATANPDATTLKDKTTAKPFLSWIGSAGLDLNFTRRAGIKLLAAYLPAETEIQVRLYDKKNKKVGDLTSKVPLDPVLLHASLFYKF